MRYGGSNVPRSCVGVVRAMTALRRARSLAQAVALLFIGAVTLLPGLHLVNHHDDHVHINGAIVPIVNGHGHIHDHHHDYPHAHHHDEPADHDDDHDDDDHATAPPRAGDANRAEHHHSAEAGDDEAVAEDRPTFEHGRGGLAHFGAAFLAGSGLTAPTPVLALRTTHDLSVPDNPALASWFSPRVTRGPPQVTGSR